MKKIIFIPAKLPEYMKTKVAAYCRVSTLSKVQRESLEWQIEHYRNLISDNPDWILAGVFYDVGKSGLRKEGRLGLKEMLTKAYKGQIDYILVKSISRLSRDTLELLKIIRALRERGINMHFETENLDSIKLENELKITLRSMLAQEESKNTSENIKWGFKRKFEKGDTRLQKTYVEDVMTGKKVKNTGQITSYYVRNSHPAIISEEIFDKVQKEMAKRSRVVYNEDGTVESKGKKYNSKYLLGNILECGYCGATYRRRTERSKVVWRCGTRMEEGRDNVVILLLLRKSG